VPVAPRYLACPKHWGMVPRWLQSALWSVYVAGQERDHSKVTVVYVAVQIRCRIAVAEKEGRNVAALRTQLVTLLRQHMQLPAELDEAGVIEAFDTIAKQRGAEWAARGGVGDRARS
jgi:hypothetical protein